MFNRNDYINFTGLISKVLELETINRDIDIEVLSSMNTFDERVAEFVSTNNIEGDIVSTSQAVTFLKKSDRQVMSDADLEKRWIGIKHASDYIWSKSFVFDLEHIHQVHRGLMREVETTGGIFKTKINQVGSLVTTHPDDVSKEILNLFTTYTSSRMNDNSVFNIIPFISELLAIHPYEDGNGKISRLLFNWMIYNAGYKFAKYVSISKFLWLRKEQYIGALESRNSAWARKSLIPQDLIPLFEVFLDTLIDAAKYARVLSGKIRLTELDFKEKLPNALNTERSFSQIKEILNFSNSDASIKKWLTKLVDDDFIKRKGLRKTTKYYI